MMKRSLEILVGVFVAAGFAAMLTLAMQVSNLSRLDTGSGYQVTAFFDNIGGLKAGAPVTVSGVAVGRVSGIRYNADRYMAEVTMDIAPQHDYLSVDTSASIYTAGLLGEQYLALEPGGSLENLKDGDVIEFTQSALVLEEIIGDLMVRMTTN
ncbi:MAG: outer membrane lipid asymmetry maintenance protein MlaD [Gammaproteobacteria bacterium]|nr:outer membrane lipid asymmetry maintenance protein MlaD [Gammaproteobacteria bacterium]